MNIKTNNQTGVKETREVIRALSALAVRTIRNVRDDNRISLSEGIAYLAELSSVKEALADIHKVPDEVLDLTTEELALLRADIRQGLIEVGITHRLADITDRAVQWLHDTLEFTRFIINAPPTAITV